LSKHNLINKRKCVFRANHPTKLAINELLNNFDNKLETFSLFLDLLKAFECADVQWVADVHRPTFKVEQSDVWEGWNSLISTVFSTTWLVFAKDMKDMIKVQPSWLWKTQARRCTRKMAVGGFNSFTVL